MSTIPSARAPESPESLVHPSVLEGLFLHALQPTGALAEALREAGYDPQRPQRQYPGRVLKACLEVACRHVHPDVPPAEAMRRLGESLCLGLLRTPLGRTVGVSLPLLDPEGVLRRLPRSFSLLFTATRVSVHREGEREWRVELWDLHPLPHFDAGLISRVLERTGVQAQVTVAEALPEGSLLRVHW